MHDPYNLERFVSAQANTYHNVVAELERGRKTSHWMWYVFPQVAGLGSSLTAERYAIKSLEEAGAYLAHNLLGPRLLQCTRLVGTHHSVSAEQIFGFPDYLKFRSCMTLFCIAGKQHPEFQRALDLFYGGIADAGTLGILDGLRG